VVEQRADARRSRSLGAWEGIGGVWRQSGCRTDPPTTCAWPGGLAVEVKTRRKDRQVVEW
jgi:hypothetical protein